VSDWERLFLAHVYAQFDQERRVSRWTSNSVSTWLLNIARSSKCQRHEVGSCVW
jgi:hypothetical protein